MSTPDEFDDDFDQDVCWQCGGEGFVVSCFDEGACVDPESGCDYCTRKCDVCHPPTPQQQAETAALRQVLADALNAPLHATKGKSS